MNYAFTKCVLDYFAYGKMNACQAADKLNDLLARNTDTVNDMMLNLLDSHDTDRFYSEVSENPGSAIHPEAMIRIAVGVWIGNP